MKRNLLHSRMALIVVAFLSVSAIITSCLDDDYYFEQAKKYYNKQWLKLIGPIPVEHDWSVAQQINATFDIAQEAEGEQTVRIYTHHPLDERCRLLARTTINGTGEVKFDMLKGHKDVYVRVTNAHQEITFEGYFMLEGTKLAVTPQTIATRLQSRLINDERVWAENCTIEVPDAHRNGLNEYCELKDSAYNTTVDMGHLHYFEHNKHTERVRLNFRDSIYPIIHDANGHTAIFQESRDNRAKATQGVEYVTQSPTDIELTYIFGATGFYNSFGYFYWNPSEGETYKDAHKIVLMNDARPQNNLRINRDNATDWDHAETFGNGSGLGNLISHGTTQWNPNPSDSAKATGIKPLYIHGTKYKLVYYGKDYKQEPTYTFPEGTHIGFFIYNNYVRKNNGQYAYDVTESPLTSSYNDYHKTLVYSLPDYNKDINEFYDYRRLDQKKDTITGVNGIGEVSAVTYNYKGHTILGFEDGIDKDMNDILLLVDADVRTDQGVIEDIEEESFIIACEDLGNTGDYDFNDVVFKVSHVGGSDKLNIIPLASGGTLPVVLHYTDLNDNKHNICTFRPNATESDDDFHKLIDPNATMKENSFNPYKPLNVRKGQNIIPGDTITITVPEDYTINKNQFTVEVKKGYGTSVYIEQGSIYIEENAKDKDHNKAPQMMILPGNWNWPTEGTLILDAYPDFSGWTREEESSAFWYNNRKTEHLVDYTSTEGENGGGTGGGEVETPQEPEYVPVSIPVYVNGNSQGTLTTYKHPTYHNEVIDIPSSWFSNQGNTITLVAKQGITQTISAGLGLNVSLGTSENGTLEGAVMASEWQQEEVDNKVPFRFWCDAKNIERIEIRAIEYILFDDFENGHKCGIYNNQKKDDAGNVTQQGSATISTTNIDGRNVMKYTNNQSVDSWLNEIVYTGLDGKITNGTTYLLTLDIKGSTTGSFSGGFRSANGAQGHLANNIPITTEWQTVQVRITCNNDGATRLLFDLGHYQGDIYFDNLKLEILGRSTVIHTTECSTIDYNNGWWKETPDDASITKENNALVITNNNTGGNIWDLQLQIARGFNVQAGGNYIVRITMKATNSGHAQILLGGWGNIGEMYNTLEFTQSDDYKTYEVEYFNSTISDSNKGIHVLWQGRHYNGTATISKVEVIELQK